jgi:hypothetical protein
LFATQQFSRKQSLEILTHQHVSKVVKVGVWHVIRTLDINAKYLAVRLSKDWKDVFSNVYERVIVWPVIPIVVMSIRTSWVADVVILR